MKELVARALRELRAFRAPAILLALYAAARLLLLLEPFRPGFLGAGGRIAFPMVVFVGGVIVLRCAVLFVVPALVVYRLLGRLNGRVRWLVTRKRGVE
jgi:hypothetical protein